MSNQKEAKKVLWILTSAYLCLVIVIYVIAFPQFRYKEISTESPSPKAVIGEIVDGVEIRQYIPVNAEQITGISLLAGIYARNNTGTLNIVLSDEQGSIVAAEKAQIADFSDNQNTTITFSKPAMTRGNQKLLLTITSEGCYPGNAITIYTGTAYDAEGLKTISETDYYKINDSAGNGMLCFSLIELQNRSFYLIYPFITLGVFLMAVVLCLIWWKQAVAGNNNPLVAVCTLFTKYQLLFKQLVSRDFKAKYKRSALGVAWSFLNPLLTMAVQYIVFSTLFRSNIENYPVYLLTGIVFFNFFSEAVTMGMTSITSNAALIKKVYVPKYIYPCTRVISSLINFSLALIPLFLVMLITGTSFGFSLLLLIFDVLCLTGFCVGVGLILSTAMTFFQDTQFLWGVINMIWMYFTPLFYPESIIPAKLIGIYRLNPLYQYVTFARTCIIDGVSPQPILYLGCVVSTVIALCLGIFLFKKNQDRFILYL